MENGITKEMFVRTLTESEYAAVESRNKKEIREITGIDRDFMVGDSMTVFADMPIEKGVYKFDWKAGKTIYYIVQKVFAEDRAFCYSIY